MPDSVPQSILDYQVGGQPTPPSPLLRHPLDLSGGNDREAEAVRQAVVERADSA